LKTAVIRSDPVVAVLPRGHRLAKQECIELEALADEDFVMWSRTTTRYDDILSLCQRAGFRPRVAHEAEGPHVLVNLVAGGLGVGLMPACEPTEKIVLVPLVGAKAQPQLAVAWRPDDPSSAVRSFVALAKREAKRRATARSIPG
jgi:DNA-binding transcriptional LysR family regulator